MTQRHELPTLSTIPSPELSPFALADRDLDARVTALRKEILRRKLLDRGGIPEDARAPFALPRTRMGELSPLDQERTDAGIDFGYEGVERAVTLAQVLGGTLVVALLAFAGSACWLFVRSVR